MSEILGGERRAGAEASNDEQSEEDEHLGERLLPGETGCLPFDLRLRRGLRRDEEPLVTEPGNSCHAWRESG